MRSRVRECARRSRSRGRSGPLDRESVASGRLGRERGERRQELVERASRLLPSPLPDGERGLRLAVAPDDDERDLLELGLADALAERLVALVHVCAVATGRKSLPERAGGPAVPLADRQDPGLHRREPEGELATEVLDEDPQEALERPEQRP